MQILLVGDVMLGRLVDQALADLPPSYPWGDTLALFQQADVCICNLECVLANSGIPWSTTPKIFHFRSSAHHVAVLQAAQMTAVSLANNHTLDFGYDALLEMLRTLKTAEILYAGAGHNTIEAASPALWEVGGLKMGMPFAPT